MQIPHYCRPLFRISFISSFGLLVLMLISSPPAVRSQTIAPDVDAKLLSLPKVEYPPIAKEAAVGGDVFVRVSVDEKGRATDASFYSGPGGVCPAVTTPPVVA